jgi:acetylornithine deacetylase/succinyl-diaminopimelate desuccinylase-like protein
VNVVAILEAVEALLGEGFTPERTVHLAFGHDEEVGGRDGGRPVALVGVAEIGTADLATGVRFFHALVRGSDALWGGRRDGQIPRATPRPARAG